MRVIHIIPSAFEYFDDIRTRAFQLLEELHKLGVENEAFTLQYALPNKAQKSSVAAASASTHSHIGNFDINSAIESFSDFDIVHLHCPFFGAAGKILRWKKLNPNVPLVVSYYRPVRVEDLMSLCIRFYNMYYLPRIFKLANAVAEMGSVDGVIKEKGGDAGSIAAQVLLMYNNL